MGKTKKKARNQALKEATNPVGVISVQDAERIAQETKTQDITPPVVKTLDSLNPGEREQACMSLSNIILENNGEHIDLLVRTKAIHKLTQKLCDPFKPVRTAAAGALRNAMIVGGEKMCDLLVKGDILTTISAALSQAYQFAINPPVQQQNSEAASTDNIEDDIEEEVMEDEPQSNKRGKKKNNKEKSGEVLPIDETAEVLKILYQVMILLSFLCENSDIATGKVTTGNYGLEHPLSYYLVQILVNPATNQYAPLVKTTMNALNVISDENLKFNSQLQQYNMQQILAELITSQNSNNHLKVSAASILFNINYSLNANLVQTVNVIFPVLRDTLGFYDCIRGLNELLPAVTAKIQEQQPEYVDSTKEEEHVNYYDDEDNTLFTPEYGLWKLNIQAQRMAFEVLANIVNAFNSTADHKMVDFDDEDENQESDQTTIETPKELAEFFAQSGIFNIVLDKCLQLSQQGALANMNIPETKLINSGLLRGLGCLSNILIAMDNNILSKIDLLKLWNFTFELCKFTCSAIQNVDSLDRVEELTSILWSILRAQLLQSNPQNTAHLFSCATLFAELAINSPNESIRTNSIGILGELGKIPHDLEKNAQLAVVLNNRLSDSSLTVLSEVLNAVFDIYSDEKYDRVLVESGLLKKLQVMVSMMQHRIQQSKNEVTEDVVFRAKEARLNLQRFVKYKNNL